MRARFTLATGKDDVIDKGEIGLPLCIGDGGLDDVAFTAEKSGFSLALTYGSGPNEVLQFSRLKGQWRLTFAEWIDH